MSNKFDRKKTIKRFKMMAWCAFLIGLWIIGKAAYTATAMREYWTEVAERLQRDSVEVKPVRGNILSSDGELMASSLPEYKLVIDFGAMHESGTDTLWTDSMVTAICEGLYDIYPIKTVEELRANLEEGYAKRSRYWPIWRSRVSYDIYKKVSQLPILCLNRNKSGFYGEEYNARQRPFGSLAKRTIGEMYGGKDTARCGLELTYDSILRGKPGLVQRRKVLNQYLSLTEQPAIDGCDIVTTIDVDIQDLAERALIKELKEINANVGVAIVMEVKTGDVKAIVNMTKCADGEYYEIKNNAVSDLLEPGSVFKTASIMVALDDGVVDTTFMVDTGSGIWEMHGSKMKDHNWHRGGYGVISLPRALEVSSNIGVSRIIDQFYGKEPEKFVQGIYDLGLAEDFEIPIYGASPARIRMPEKNSKGQYTNWSKTALPWMSIGYETQVPPITTVTFYNAIANDGKMMRPRFVKGVVRDGEMVEEFPPVVVKEHIAKPQTVETMQTILTHVVSQGLGKRAGSKNFKVAGKTGTAQISQGKSGYKAGKTSYLISFCGFFPADEPRYTCIVCIQKTGLPASGGLMCGAVFHEISEGIMAQSLKMDVNDARDTASVMLPDVKDGNMAAADYVLSSFDIATAKEWNGCYASGEPVWGTAEHADGKVQLQATRQADDGVVPDVVGMGARDAVMQMEQRGIKVHLKGRGKVAEQSLDAGSDIIEGDVCTLRLSL